MLRAQALAAEPDAAPNEGSAASPQHETLIVDRLYEEVPREDVAAAASVITADRVPRSGESLPQLISELPGTTVTRFGGIGSSAFVSLRGSSWEQVRIYVDGVPISLAAGGYVDLSTLPLGSVERIEIYRSMTPIGFGASALGGIVSITTRTPRHSGAEVELGAGSFGTRFGGAGFSWAHKSFRLYAAAHLLGSQGDFRYASDNGTAYDPSDDQVLSRQNNRLRQADGVVRAAVDLPGRRTLSLSTALTGQRQGLPGFSIYRTKDVSLATARGLASLSYDGREDLGPGGRLHAQLYGLLTEQRLWDPLSEITLVPSDSRDRTRALGATLRGSFPLSDRVSLAGILDGRWEQFFPRDLHRGAPRSGDAARRRFGSVGVEANVRWPALRLEIIPSARLELARDVRTGRSRFGELLPPEAPVRHAQPLGRIALVQRPHEQLVLKANLGRYARIPSFNELYGNSGFLVGNTGLQPEQALNGDLGASFTAPTGRDGSGLTVEVAAFGAWVDQLIQFQQDAYGRAHPKNIGQARIAGLEASAEGRLSRWGRLFAQFTFTDARDTSASAASGDRQLPLRPRLRAYARAELRRLNVGAGFRLGAYADTDLNSGNFLDPANLVQLPTRSLFGAGATLEWIPAGLRLTASAQNLGDSAISDVAGFPLPNRAFYVTLAGTFGESHKEHPP
jgi:iron complex outermembrane receptor protein